MDRQKLRNIIKLAKQQMLINSELLELTKDQTLDISDKATLMRATELGMESVQQMLIHFNVKYLETEAA